MGAAEFRQAAGGDADALDDEIANLRASAKKLDADKCPVPLTVRGTQTLVSFAPLAF